MLRVDRVVRTAFGLQGLYTNAGCFTVGAIIGVPLAVAAIMRGDESASVQWFCLGGAFLVIAAWQWWSIRQSFEKNPLINQEIRGAVNDDGLQMTTPDSETKIAWSGFGSMLATRDCLLLIRGNNEAFGVPLNFFASETDFSRACSLARTRIPGKPPARSLARRVWNLLVWIVVIVVVFLLWSLFQTTRH